jgi:DNA-binding response OmpR family regulator
MNLCAGMSVLYVENDVLMRETMAKLHRTLGMTVHTATNGCEGLRLFGRRSPEIVMTEVVMPCMDGIEMLREIRAVRSETPVIVISDGKGEHWFEELEIIGVTNYFRKPVQMKQVYAALEGCCKEVLRRTETPAGCAAATPVIPPVTNEKEP